MGVIIGSRAVVGMQLHPGMSWREREAAKKEYFDK